jgi:hypothetical protein
MVDSGWNRQKPATGYDHGTTACTFLTFSGVFQHNTARTLLPGNMKMKFVDSFQLGVVNHVKQFFHLQLK